MQNNDKATGKLTAVELAAIDLTITVLQAAGHSINELSKDDNPREAMQDAVIMAHQGIVELTERDREIISQIKDLAGQLSSRVTLSGLLEARAKVIRGQTG
jgi:hypothetical protein